MFRIGELEAFTGPMSNYSVYFLSKDANVYTNCSVYSLISGSIMSQDFDSQVWQNDTLDYLPAYYVTNCSISDLVQQIRNQNSSAADVAAWFKEYYTNPYNVADNGDSFVALLYMISGSSVSCWMLLLLILLSPKHKRKPLLTQIAMLVYSSVLTAIFVKLTRVARDQYYADSLDMVRLFALTVERPFTISLAVSELLTNLAYLQLFLKISRHKWGHFNRWFVLCITAACLAIYSVVISRVKSNDTTFVIHYDTYRSCHVSLNVVFMAWFAGNLGYYSVCGTATAPREVSYARKLLPLASLTWLNIGLYLIVSILILSLWNEAWLVNVWVSFLPPLLKMYILITSWEWFYSIRHVEQKLELSDVLGRRISVDDIEAFNNDNNEKSAFFQSRFSSILNFLSGKGHSETGSSKVVDQASVISKTSTGCDSSRSEGNVGSHRNVGLSRDLGSNRNSGSDQILGSGYQRGSDDYRDDELWDDASHQEVHMDNADLWEVTDDEITSRPVDVGSRQSTPLANGEARNVHTEEPIVQAEASSGTQAEELPSFTPHPGYHVDDYWGEKRTNN